MCEHRCRYRNVRAVKERHMTKCGIEKNDPAHEIMVLTISHRRPAKAQASLRIRSVSPEPSLFAHMRYQSRRRDRRKIRHLAPLDGCACEFEDWVYGGRKVPESHELAQMGYWVWRMCSMMRGEVYSADLLASGEIWASSRENLHMA